MPSRTLWTKQHILAEIRRTAAANGGVPLGRARFATETGIRESDWIGKIWVRWNDALAEAGFGPNAMVARRSDEEMLERLAALVAELGHYPVAGELRLKSHTDKTFPNFKTYERFGGKRQVAARLRDYCIQRGRDDIAALCEPVIAGSEHVETDSAVPVSQAQLGEVYLAKSGRYYKIGRTMANARRQYELAIQLPEKVRLVHSIKTDDPVGIEAYWHKRFEARRGNGEWFDLKPEDVMAFKRRKFM